MKIEVVPTVDEVKLEHIKHRTVIVIDVFRASSTIAAALAHGANEVIPVETVGQARVYERDGYVLAGERYGKKIVGFPFANSPTEMTTASLNGCSLVLTTTNGTRAIQKSWKAADVLIGSFLNGTACAALAMRFKRDLTILCAGSRQQFSLEDGLCAGYIASIVTSIDSRATVNDFGKAMTAAYQFHQHDLPAILKSTMTGKRLVQAGYEADLAFCAQKDHYELAPILRQNAIVRS